MASYEAVVSVQLYDEADDRFWYGTFNVSDSGPLDPEAIYRRAEQLMYQQFQGAQYEALVDWLATSTWTPSYEIQAIYQTG